MNVLKKAEPFWQHRLQKLRCLVLTAVLYLQATGVEVLHRLYLEHIV
jgi:hypothetical protein